MNTAHSTLAGSFIVDISTELLLEAVPLESAMIGELTSEQIEHLLQTQAIGRIGCHANGITYIVPVSYVYHDNRVYGHSDEGLKLRLARANPEVCFEVERIEICATGKR